MFTNMKQHIIATLDEIKEKGLYKNERVIASPQGAHTTLADGRKVINMCANNYLGLSNDPELIDVARASYEKWGYGLSSVRFICGTQELHKQLENKISEFLGTEDTILYSSCFDANGGLFETLLTAEDAIISDSLNHASIIDGIRLCKAQRFRYKNRDMGDLEEKLKESNNTRMRLIATDGVFSMDGTIAPLKEICDLADKYDAAVMVDDSHAVGFMGTHGRGTHEYCEVMDRIDIITGTFGKALGGASGGFTSGRREVIELLRQRSRPYLFSNSLAPVIADVTLAVLNRLTKSTELRDKLAANTARFREKMQANGFDIPDGDHPIVPIMLGDARLATTMADMLLDEGIYVIGFSYPVVPEGKARIRVQISAAHSEQDIDKAVNAFTKIHKQLTS